MHRFFVEPSQIDPVRHQIEILGADVHHMKQVLRMKPGEEVRISDGKEKEYLCRITSLGEESLTLEILS